MNTQIKEIADYAWESANNPYDRNKIIRDKLEPMRKEIELMRPLQMTETIEQIYSACNGVGLLNSAARCTNQAEFYAMLDQCLYLGDC